MKRATTKHKSTAKGYRDVAVHRGSGNVFGDLGLPDAGERLAKAELAHEIGLLIKSAKLTQVQAARRLGIDQPKVSALLRGRLKDFSTDRLLRFINRLGRDICIVIRPPGRGRREGADGKGPTGWGPGDGGSGRRNS